MQEMDRGLIAPPGEMVEARGAHFHVRRFASSSETTFILETGLAMFSMDCPGVGEARDCDRVRPGRVGLE